MILLGSSFLVVFSEGWPSALPFIYFCGR